MPKELLKALAMPFHLGSLMFVAMTSMMLAVVLSVGGIAVMLALPAACLILVCLTQYAFAMIDDAANGAPEAATVSAEMFSPIADLRCWVHPLLTAVVGTALWMQPDVSRLAMQIVAALLFPASLGAMAISGHAQDALNPFAMGRVVRGLGPYYLWCVLWVALCAALAVLVTSLEAGVLLRAAALQLLLLLAYAFIGGALFVRRVDLGFVPRASPERKEERVEKERATQRQQLIDGLYRDLRVREPARAIASAKQWIEQAGQQQLHGDVKAILDAGARWNEPRGFAQLLRSLIPQLLSMRQPGLAFAAVEAGINALPGFTPEQESEAIAMIRFAIQTGRKRLAATLLANFTASTNFKGTPGPELAELRARLHNEPAAP
jgi:hypothetical protein